MTTYYAGMTVYLNDAPHVREKLSLLAEVMKPLQGLVPALGEDLFGQGTILDGNQCTYLAWNNDMFQNAPENYPVNTPAWRQIVSLNEVLISGRPGLRIHIPVTHNELLEVGNMVNFTLFPLFTDMFEKELCGVKVKNCTNTDDLERISVVDFPLPAYCVA